MTKHKRPASRDDARTEPKSNTDDVASLINERRKFEEWIAALEAKKAQTPAPVFTRVHADYQSRLQAVIDKLASHTSSLGDEVAGLKKKLETVDDEISRHQDERAEIELRAQVGELDSTELAEALRAADEELAQLAASRTAIEADLVRVNEFFAAASGGPAPSGTRPQQARASFDELSFLQSVVGEAGERKKPVDTWPKPKLERERHEEDSTAASPSDSPPQRTGERPALRAPEMPAERLAEKPAAKPAERPVEALAGAPIESVSEKAVEKPVEQVIEKPAVIVTEKPAEKNVAKPVAERASEPPAAPNSGLGIEKESEPLVEKAPPREARLSIAMQQMSQTIEPEDLPRTSIGIVKANESSPSLLDGISSKAQAGEKPFAANVASNNPLSLKSATKGDVKTLKCRECGAMNDPTEWYCERCGAELSGL